MEEKGSMMDYGGVFYSTIVDEYHSFPAKDRKGLHWVMSEGWRQILEKEAPLYPSSPRRALFNLPITVIDEGREVFPHLEKVSVKEVSMTIEKPATPAERYPVGAKVHVEFDGEIVDSTQAAKGFMRVQDKNDIVHHVWPGEAIKAVEPEYEVGELYRDAAGRYYLRLSPGLNRWRSTSGTPCPEYYPRRPLVKMVPEK